MRLCTLLVPLLTAISFGQPTEQTVIGNARAVLTAPPDEITGSIQLTASLGFTAAQAVRVLAGAGVREQDLTGVQVGNPGFAPVLPGSAPPRPVMTYHFAPTAPAARFREITDALAVAARQLPTEVISLTYSLSLITNQRALDEARLRLLPATVGDARRRAEALAGQASIANPSLVAITESTQFSLGQPGALRQFLVVDVRLGRAPQRTVFSSCSRAVTLAPDQAVFQVRARTPMATPREAVLETVAKAKIEPAHLISVQSSVGGPLDRPIFQPIDLLAPEVIYDFLFAVPVAQFAETVNALMELQRERGSGISEVLFAAGLNPSAGAETEARQRTAVSLVPECRQRAEALARAAAARIGAVQGFAETGGFPPIYTAAFAPQVISEYRRNVFVSMQFALE